LEYTSRIMPCQENKTRLIERPNYIQMGVQCIKIVTETCHKDYRHQGGYRVDKSNEELLKKAYDLGFKYEQEYGGCCQCAILAIQEAMGIENDDVFKAGTGLVGGIGATGAGSCGALIGGAMAISSRIGRERKNFRDPERISWQTYELAKKLHEKFVAEYGSGNCFDVQKKIFGRSFNLWDTDDQKAFEKAGGHVDKCPSVVGNASRWAVELLLEQ